jgi:hypothetical protein
MDFEAIEHESVGQAAAILPQPRKQLTTVRRFFHAENPRTFDMNLDIVTLFEPQGLYNCRG